MTVFKPHKVPSNSYKIWFSQGLQLSMRKPVWFLAATVIYALTVRAVPHQIDTLSLFVFPIFLAICIRAAKCADTGETLLPKEYLSKKSSINLFIYYSCPFLFFASLNSALSLLFKHSAISSASMPVFEQPTDFVFPFETGAIIFCHYFIWMVIPGILNWFGIPLIALQETGFIRTYALVFEALSKNLFVVLKAIVISGVIAFVLPLISTLLIFPFMAISACSIYTSYRHVFTGCNQNKAVLKNKACAFKAVHSTT